jgi:hypothetical protein
MALCDKNIITQVVSPLAPVPFCWLTLPHEFCVSTQALPDFVIIAIECADL